MRSVGLDLGARHIAYCEVSEGVVVRRASVRRLSELEPMLGPKAAAFAALVDMARRSGIVVVAEGIETVDERDTLVDLGCDLLQGYLFAKPGPPFPAARTTFERK